MKKILLIALLLISASHLFAQTELTLTNESSVNSQIVADRAGGNPADVYIAPSGSILYWDATLQVDFDLVIRGESTEWIGRQTSPAVFVPIPDAGGVLFTFAQVTAGSITLENILMSGQNSVSPTEVIGNFITEVGATEVILDNCAFVDLDGNVVQTDSSPDLVSVTNCMMINSHNLRDRPWGGHFGRFNVAPTLLIMENNTYVNHGRLLGNGGNFYESDLIENHITSVNCQTNAQNLHWKQGLMANNIFYNWSWLGRQPSDVAYNYSITTFETYADLALDSVSLYFGRNLLYRDPAIKEYYDNELAGYNVTPYITWNDDVDTTITEDDNFTIGKNYWDIDPGFVTPTDNLDKMMGWLSNHYDSLVTEWVDWRSPSPVTYDANGQPVVSWPPAFDLSYTQENMLVGGTDGLPMGDLNWFPDKKATYDANRESYIAALVDSITMATALYIPGDSLSERITLEDLTAVETYSKDVPNQYYLSSNYPNPFNPSTTIRFGLPEQSKVTLSVFNILGQKVFEMTEKSLAAGVHSYNFNANALSSGIYVYTIHATGTNGKNFDQSKKMMLLK